jgi:hypothetical protein
MGSLNEKKVRYMPNELIEISTSEVQPLLEKSILNVRDEIKDNPYIIEALKVLPVGGYRRS